MRLVPLIQRAFDSTLANWPVLLIRIAGSVAMTIVVLAAIVPVVMFAIYGGMTADFETITSSADMLEWMTSNVIAILALVIVITLIIAVAIAIHSFITGGIAGVFLDADLAAPIEGWARSQLAVFSPDRWMSHAMRTWWPVFIIYNITWGVWFLILLLPIAAVVPLLLAMEGNEALGVLGCVILVFWVLAAIIGSILVHVWTEMAILECVRGEKARYIAPIRDGFTTLIRNLGRVIVLILLMIVITIAISSVSLGFQFGFELGMRVDELAFLFLPVQIVLSLVQTVISVFMSAWLMACFARIVNEARAPQPPPPTAPTHP